MNWQEKFLNKVTCGDCLQLMKELPDKCVDLCLVDPPYGVGYEYDIYEDTAENLQNLIANVMPNILRVSKRTLLTPGTNNVWKYPEPKWMMCWYYGTTNALNPWGFTSWQPILAYGKDPYLENRMGARMDVIKDAHAPEQWIKEEHGCPKPIEFWKKLLLRGSVHEGDIIFDPFLGSGTTAVAAKHLKRNFIGFEISEKYCEMARQRLRQEILL